MLTHIERRANTRSQHTVCQHTPARVPAHPRKAPDRSTHAARPSRWPADPHALTPARGALMAQTRANTRPTHRVPAHAPPHADTRRAACQHTLPTHRVPAHSCTCGGTRRAACQHTLPTHGVPAHACTCGGTRRAACWHTQYNAFGTRRKDAPREAKATCLARFVHVRSTQRQRGHSTPSRLP